MARRKINDDEQILNGFKTNSQVKNEIKKAQAKLRRAPKFMKDIAELNGGKLSTAVTYNELIRNYQKAQYINSHKEFTPSGFKRWEQSVANELRISYKEMDFIISQIDIKTMDFVRNSKLRYGSNPQLDYAFESAVEVKEALTVAMNEISQVQGYAEDLYKSVF